MTRSPPANLDSAGEKKPGKKDVVRLSDTVSHLLLPAQTDVIRAEDSCEHELLSVHIPWTLLNARQSRKKGVCFWKPGPTLKPYTFLTGKASSWPRKTQTPEMELLLLVPKRMTLAKAFFLSLSNRWNIPEGTRENIQPWESHHPLPCPPSLFPDPPSSHQ